MKNKRSSISWGDDPRKMTEDDLLPCPKCGSNAGRATKRATVFTNFLGMWKVSCQKHECPLAMIYFHPVEWNELPRISQREYDELQAECEKLRSELDAHKAARIAYAYEFPPDEDGQPDVGSIHQNIRKLKEEVKSGARIVSGERLLSKEV